MLQKQTINLCYEYDGLVPKLKEDAPKEAQESFEHYLQQKKRNGN